MKHLNDFSKHYMTNSTLAIMKQSNYYNSTSCIDKQMKMQKNGWADLE